MTSAAPGPDAAGPGPTPNPGDHPTDEGDAPIPPDGAPPSRRRVEISAARIVAINALIGAIVAALVAGGVAIWSASFQSSSEDARATSSFLRSERKAAYADYISAEYKLLRAIYELDPATNILNDPKTIAAANDTTDRAAVVKLVGSQAAGDAMDRLNSEAGGLWASRSRDTSTQAIWREKFDAALKDFISICRRDLDIP
jgi:hypothetical protein